MCKLSFIIKRITQLPINPQKFHAVMFKHLNLTKNNDFDDAAIEKHMEKHVKDSEWLQLEKNAYKTCMKEMRPFFDLLQKYSNKTKEECDVKYAAVIECTQLNMFLVVL
jgi:hypothetical protein